MDAATITATNYHSGPVEHVVLFHYKDDVTPTQKGEVAKRFLALQQECQRDGHPYVLSIKAGAQNSGEGVAQGFEEGFEVEFASEGDRNYYVGQPVVTDSHHYDPAHQAFKDFVGPLLSDKNGVLVFDFDAQSA
jgi:hypothetical protein